MSHIDELREVIRKLHGAEATHRESVPVKEVHNGRTVWEGIVEVFDLSGHPSAEKAYAWAHDTDDPDNPTRHVTVLHSGPVTSPFTAVRAFIVQEFRSNAALEA
jgi:hypothetical protein